MNGHVFNLLACLVGSCMLIFNRQVAEGARSFQVAISGSDYGLSSFRVPFLAGGIIFVVLGVVTW